VEWGRGYISLLAENVRRLAWLEVLTGERPQVTEMPNGRTRIRDSDKHIDALARYEELREAIERWSNHQ
jgi:hypothetical protein